jgi:hypothetical protein
MGNTEQREIEGAYGKSKAVRWYTHSHGKLLEVRVPSELQGSELRRRSWVTLPVVNWFRGCRRDGE